MLPGTDFLTLTAPGQEALSAEGWTGTHSPLFPASGVLRARVIIRYSLYVAPITAPAWGGGGSSQWPQLTTRVQENQQLEMTDVLFHALRKAAASLFIYLLPSHPTPRRRLP